MEMTLNSTVNGNLSDAFRQIHEDEERQRERAEADKAAAKITIALSADSTNRNPPAAAELVAAMRLLGYAPAKLIGLREVDCAYRKMRSDHGQLAAQRAEANRLEAKAAGLWNEWEATRREFVAARDLSIKTGQLGNKLQEVAKEARELFVFERGELPELLADSIG